MAFLLAFMKEGPMLPRTKIRNYMKKSMASGRCMAALLMIESRSSRWMISALVGLVCFSAGQNLAFYSTPTVPVVEIVSTQLSDGDKQICRALFAAQKRGEYKQANQLIGELDNKLLLGHVLAQRYLNSNYKTSGYELSQWLKSYHDHPQASKIAALAAKKGAAADMKLVRETLKGDGYIDHLGRTGMTKDWYRALALWKSKSYGPAGRLFAKIGDDEKLSGWQRAAGYYWAFRSEYRMGQKRAANKHLANAAEFQTTFYGLLAMRQSGDWPQLTAAAPYVPLALRDDAHVIRAQALATIGEHDMAEEELRQLYFQLDSRDRPAVLALASEVGLANLQVRLAGMKGLSQSEQLFGRYPMPTWIVKAQDKVDPALVLAIARQESVFRTQAISTGGAVGMMQMLPSTAKHIERRLSAEDALATAAVSGSSLPLSKQLTDASINIRLGAQYVEILKAQPMVKGDLIKTLAAYNAGPGSVQSWEKAARNIDDPLLYVESIPYGETRNYVMQVMAHYWVYKMLLGEYPDSLSTLADGEWPQA